MEEKEDQKEQSAIPEKKELLDMLDEMRKNIDQLPSHAMLSPVTHCDFSSLIMLLSAILRSD